MKRLTFMVVALFFAITVFGQGALIWSDEFNDSDLDLTKWNYETGTGVNGDWGTGQLDRATDRTENVAIEQGISGADGGCLRITTINEYYIDRDYTSGRINTADKFSWGPGHRIVARVWPRDVKYQGQGFAFWMMPDEVPDGYDYIMWPQGGEIDIMEYVGSIPYHNLGTVHYAWFWEDNLYQDWNHGHLGAYYSFETQQVPDPPEWLMVDLGSQHAVNRVVLRWESYGKTYHIQVSNDANNWSTVFTTSNGDGGDDDISFGTTNARYVRMYGTERSSDWGYSLIEMEVYESGNASNIAAGHAAYASSVQADDLAAQNACDGSLTTRWGSALRNPDYGNYPPPPGDPNAGSTAFHEYGIDWYEDRIEWFIDDHVFHIHYLNDGGAFDADGGDQAEVRNVDGRLVNYSEYSNHFPEWYPFEHQFYAILSAGVGGGPYTYGGAVVPAANFPCSVFIDWIRVYDHDGTPPPPPPPPCDLISQNKPANASSQEGDYVPSNVTDGDMNSRWSSDFSDPQWITIDLQQEYNICSVILEWEAAYGSNYEIQLSNDASFGSYNVIASVSGGDGGTDQVTTNDDFSGRYIRMYGTQRGTGWGYSLWEFEVYGESSGPVNPYLASLDINPKGITMCHNAIETFTVTGTDQYGDPYALGTVNWSASQGSIVNGQYTPDGAGNVRITAESEGVSTYTDIVVEVCGVTCDLISQGRPASTSSVEGDYVAANAVDGNTGTRWASAYEDNQWIQIDLGAEYSICSLMLNWETAYSSAYEVQLSNDPGFGSYSVIYSESNGDGGIDNFNTDQSSSGSYIRLFCIQRATGWGNSLWELEVYGTPESGGNESPIADAGSDINVVDTDGSGSESVTLDGSGSYDPDGIIVSYVWSIGGSTIGSGINPNVNLNVGTHPVNLTVTDNEGATSSDEVVVTVTAPPTGNIALNKPALSSVIEGGLPPGNINDGDMGTRWGSEWVDNAYVTIDLEAEYSISNVVIYWEAAYGSDYEMQLSNDPSFATYNVIASVSGGNGGTDDLTTNSAVSGRYLRMQGISRGTGWGYSIFELEAYGLPKSAESFADNHSGNLKVYPNPTSGAFTVELNTSREVNLSVLDVMGRVVFNNSFEPSAESVMINLDHLNSGVYYIVAEDAQRLRTSTIMLNK